ncbi:Lipopolysaccharide transport system ATP-binding protein [Vibrio chagasii]|nr:Lipopolysaccharide transport system ATP-binding protein [Vibrio chagasii]CAH6936846.1 Lipopolysaccharide transport system ATP-binding protein [Vibrio chagasii]CAH7086485.1 Lipopolysaccharide transport system ATP-binding protein [Vibrio chagasii]CAH7127215.1 Lipopolysaccharide transport system ATP-binding protein [Vibrio chagasii]
MSDIAISCSGITKTYPMYNNAKDRFKEALHPFRKSYHEDFYALKDVSFEVKRGDTVGIIGGNGAGKSTLLKIITGVLTPTSGTMQVNGVVSSILELGTGFNSELTGIENIYVNSSLMGVTKEDVDKKLQSIIDFADIGEHIYQPVRGYSSGMFARLAFSIAISIDPDILIVDEALAVGDMAFQAKCMLKMKEMVDRGVTLFFVSHDISSVQSLCNAAIYMDKGTVVECGEVDKVTSLYMEVQRKKNNEHAKESTLQASHTDKRNIVANVPPKNSWNNGTGYDLDLSGRKELNGKVSGNLKCKILDYKLLNNNGVEASEFLSNKPYSIQIAIEFNEDLDSFCVVTPIRSLNGVQEIGVSSTCEKLQFPSVKKGEIYIVEIKSIMNIQYGVYNLVLSIEIPIEPNVVHEFAYVLENCETFRVVWDELKFPTKFYTKGAISYEKIN